LRNLEAQQDKVSGNDDEFASKMTMVAHAVRGAPGGGCRDRRERKSSSTRNSPNFNGDSIESFFADWSARAAEVKVRMDAATDPRRRRATQEGMASDLSMR